MSLTASVAQTWQESLPQAWKELEDSQPMAIFSPPILMRDSMKLENMVG
jgi:hypothetical protein